MSSCIGCDGGCCSRYYVTLTHSEALRIACAGHDPVKFLSWPDVCAIKTDHPDIRIGDEYRYMALEREQDGTCVFAKRQDGRLSCSIHGIHPASCRIYPIDPVSQKIRKDIICKRKWEYNREIGRAYAEDIVERRQYIMIARKWNTSWIKRRTARDFLSFAGIKMP